MILEWPQSSPHLTNPDARSTNQVAATHPTICELDSLTNHSTSFQISPSSPSHRNARNKDLNFNQRPKSWCNPSPILNLANPIVPQSVHPRSPPPRFSEMRTRCGDESRMCSSSFFGLHVFMIALGKYREKTDESSWAGLRCL
ncbi:hypothetical protein Droror1_Dr00006538 [Drosera rotundifolia]